LASEAANSVIRQLLKKPSAVFALFVIAVTCFAAAFAYVIVPDRTPSANTMIIELGARQPGFTKTLLQIPKALPPSQPGTIQGWLHGVPSACNSVPINGYHFGGNRIFVRHYIDEGIEDTLSYPLAQLLPIAVATAPLQTQQEYTLTHNIVNRTFYLGTDRFSRDILSRLVIGSRVTLAVGFIAVLLSLSIGIVLGALAGYYGRWVDGAVMWVVNILYAIPTLLLVFAITLTIGKGFLEIFVAIGLSMWVGAARLVRGQVMAVKEQEFIVAARTLGLSDIRIIFRHILPNIAGPIMVIAASNFASAILIEAGLSFLGFGVQPPEPSWGLMIKEHYNFLLSNRPLLALIPGIAIMLLVFAFNIIGNTLRDILDVRS
jgi:ABC-type dipeptide/oligopeptide/nickel transport system permease subunit